MHHRCDGDHHSEHGAEDHMRDRQAGRQGPVGEPVGEPGLEHGVCSHGLDDLDHDEDNEASERDPNALLLHQRGLNLETLD